MDGKVYINPDVNHPLDGESEHAYTSYLASKNYEYHSIPVEYEVTNYSITPKTDPSFGMLIPYKGVTKLNTIDIASLELVNFGYGVSRGGRHTWVYSKGKIYEVHWDKIGTELYESTPIRTFTWFSGTIVVPPDQAVLLANSARLNCG